MAEAESTGWHTVGIQHVVAFIIIPIHHAFTRRSILPLINNIDKGFGMGLSAEEKGNHKQHCGGHC